MIAELEERIGVAVLSQRVEHLERAIEKIEARHNALVMLMLGTFGSTVLTLLIVLYSSNTQ